VTLLSAYILSVNILCILLPSLSNILVLRACLQICLTWSTRLSPYVQLKYVQFPQQPRCGFSRFTSNMQLSLIVSLQPPPVVLLPSHFMGSQV
jgi:hypothetical protein